MIALLVTALVCATVLALGWMVRSAVVRPAPVTAKDLEALSARLGALETHSETLTRTVKDLGGKVAARVRA